MEKEKMIAIVRAVQKGEEDAAGILYDSFREDLYYYILKTVNDPDLAEDLVQDTFIEILQTIDGLNEPAAFVTWSRQIAYHRCTAYFRKRHDLLADENEDGQTVFDTIAEDRAEFIPDEALDKEDLKQTIHAMIAELPMEQRSAIMMRYFDEISVKEIADIQGVSEGTVKSRLNYGRKAIKEAVEGYEKKTGVKLRCVGVVPLLLWLARGKTVATGSAAVAAKTVAAHTAANAATSAVTEGVKAGAKVAGKIAAKKLIVGVAAAAVVTGGAVTTIILRPEPEDPPTQTTVEETIKEELPMHWYGYGETYSFTRRFDITVEEMDKKHITGYLEVSYLYDVGHATEFEGVGNVEDGKVVYDLTFAVPAVVGTIPTYEYDQIQMVYDAETETFSMNDYYAVDMTRAGKESKKILEKNARWSGIGEDDTYIGFRNENHQFELYVNKMTETQISGQFKVSYEGHTDHDTAFTGRGWVQEDAILYEIKLETPRTEKPVIEITIETFWLRYDLQTKTMEIPFPCMYEVVMEKQK